MAKISRDGSTFRHSFVPVGAATYRTECVDVKFIQVFGATGLEQVPITCGKCKHCRWSRRQAIANAVEMELRTSDWALWLTLTIAPGPERASDGYDKRIEKSLMQNFQKVCRIHMKRQNFGFEGRKCTSWRYIQCGEYGGLFGRAHYHCVIFGKGEKPVWGDTDAEFIDIPEWPWGKVNVKSHVDAGVAFYLSKYMSKAGMSWHSSSSGSAIGSAYAKALGAARAVIDMLPTQDWRFVFGPKKRTALLRGAKKRDLLLAFCQAKGCEILSLARLAPKMLWPFLVATERYKRERVLGKPGPLQIERIKKAVWAELRERLGLSHLVDGKSGRPLQPAGWRPAYPAKFLGVSNVEA